MVVITYQNFIFEAMKNILSEEEVAPDIAGLTFDDAWEVFLMYKVGESSTAYQVMNESDFPERWKPVLEKFIPVVKMQPSNIEWKYRQGVKVAETLILNSILDLEAFEKSMDYVENITIHNSNVIFVNEENVPYWEACFEEHNATYIIFKVSDGYVLRRTDLKKLFPYHWYFLDEKMLLASLPFDKRLLDVDTQMLFLSEEERVSLENATDWSFKLGEVSGTIKTKHLWEAFMVIELIIELEEI